MDEASKRCNADEGRRSSEGLGLRWAEAPLRTQYGAGMMEALVALGKDHTLRLYAEAEVLHMVWPALCAAAMAAERERWLHALRIAGSCHDSADARNALNDACFYATGDGGAYRPNAELCGERSESERVTVVRLVP